MTIKKTILIALVPVAVLLCVAAGRISPTYDDMGFIAGRFGRFIGNGVGVTNVNPKAFSVVTNISFAKANGTVLGVVDEFGGFVYLDYALNQRFVWDPSSDNFSFISTNGTVKIEVDHSNLLKLHAPIMTSALIGSINGATNLPVSGLNTNGGTPGQVATAQANGTVTWSNAPAGSGTSVTFDSTQFGSASGGTNIKSGVLLTNAVNRIADETIFVTDSSGAGNPLLSWDSDNGDIRVHANLVVRDGYYGHGGNLTNLNASQLTSGTVPLARNDPSVMTNNSTLGYTNRAPNVITNAASAGSNTRLLLDGSRNGSAGSVINYTSNNVSRFDVDTDGDVVAATISASGGTITSMSIGTPQISGLTRFTGVITCVITTSSTNNFTQSGVGSQNVIRWNNISGASSDVTGMTATSQGGVYLGFNSGTNNVVFKDEDANSTAANRFALAADFTLVPDGACVLFYDATSARWRIIQ